MICEKKTLSLQFSSSLPFFHILIEAYEDGIVRRKRSKQFWQLKEFYAIAAFDKDEIARRLICFQGCFHLFDVVKFSEPTVCLLKLLSHKPYIVKARLRKEVGYLLVFHGAGFPKFPHVAQYSHLGRHFHVAEVITERYI
mgnify:FL=1